jgi:hypothetical protein
MRPECLTLGGTAHRQLARDIIPAMIEINRAGGTLGALT